VEQQAAPPAVDDHRPDFRARNAVGGPVNRFQIQVTTDPTFGTITHWNSKGPAPPNPDGVDIPNANNVGNGAFCPEIPYGEGTANLFSVPVLEWNTTYFWRIRFRRTNGVWSPFASSQFTMAAPAWSVAQQPGNGSPSGDSWRFIGVPIAFGTTVPATELLDDVPYLFRLDEPNRTWVPLGPGDVLRGGEGYLAWCPPTAVLDLSQGQVTPAPPPVLNGTGATTTPSYRLVNAFSFTTYSTPVGQEIADGVPANEYRGNHLFVNPFYAPLSWKSSTANGPPYGHVARAGISYAMYKWDGTQYRTYNGVTNVPPGEEWVAPFQAVGIWVQDANHELWINAPPPLSGGLQKTRPSGKSYAVAGPGGPDPDRWALILEARSGSALDTENAFGVDPQADDTWDVRDSEEPGSGTDPWVLVSFDHRSDWTVHPRRYTHDFRKTPLTAGSRVEWTFTVDGNTGQPATLSWTNFDQLPAGDWRFVLEDPAAAVSVDLSQAASYDTPPVNGPRTLKLRAERLVDSPALSVPPPGETGGASGGDSCGLLGIEVLLLAVLAARRGGRRI
jgi:hypothetical protein